MIVAGIISLCNCRVRKELEGEEVRWQMGINKMIVDGGGLRMMKVLQLRIQTVVQEQLKAHPSSHTILSLVLYEFYDPLSPWLHCLRLQLASKAKMSQPQFRGHVKADSSSVLHRLWSSKTSNRRRSFLFLPKVPPVCRTFDLSSSRRSDDPYGVSSPKHIKKQKDLASYSTRKQYQHMTSDVMHILPATELNMNHACLVEVTFEPTNLSRAQRRFSSLASTSAFAVTGSKQEKH
jgi:hypothetical protein